VVALIAEVLQSVERDATTASLLAAAGAAWHLMALLASDRATGRRPLRRHRPRRRLPAHPHRRPRERGRARRHVPPERLPLRRPLQKPHRLTRPAIPNPTTDGQGPRTPGHHRPIYRRGRRRHRLPGQLPLRPPVQKVHGVTPFGYRGQRKGLGASAGSTTMAERRLSSSQAPDRQQCSEAIGSALWQSSSGSLPKPSCAIGAQI
jgi:AraC family transcriptional regulator of arabinose operon